MNTLGVEADDILDQEFVNKKQQEDEVLEQIKEEYNFDEIKDAFDEVTVPQQLDFFYGGENSNFNRVVEFLSLSNKNREFIAFFLSDLGQNLMTNNSLFILKVETFSTKILTLVKTFIIFLLRNRMIRQPLSLKYFHTI